MIPAVKATLLRWHRNLVSNISLNDINCIPRLIKRYYTMTATDTTITTAIPEVAKASISTPSQAATTVVAPQDAANLPADEGTAPVAKEPAVAAKPAAKTRAKVSAKAAIPVVEKSAVAAKPAVKSVARLPAKAAAAPAAKKAAVAAKPDAKAVSKIPAKPAGKSVPAVTVAQTVLKPATKPVFKTPAKASSTPAVGQKAEKTLKEKKPKLVRDSFTIPKAEYTVLDELKHRAGKLGASIKKSELIRAGIKALAAMPDAMYLGALKVVPTVKTGRPSKK